MLQTIHRRPDAPWLVTLAGFLVVALALAGTAFVIALAGAALFAGPAGAQADTVVVDVPTGAVITFGSGIMALITGTVTPVLTGILTRIGTSSAVKALVSFALMGVLAVINVITVGGGTFETWSVLIVFAETVVFHVASWLMIWQPVDAGGPNAPLNGVLFGP